MGACTQRFMTYPTRTTETYLPPGEIYNFYFPDFLCDDAKSQNQPALYFGFLITRVSFVLHQTT
jgi:hypothetical protein